MREEEGMKQGKGMRQGERRGRLWMCGCSKEVERNDVGRNDVGRPLCISWRC
jgi:hypothetical protein